MEKIISLDAYKKHKRKKQKFSHSSSNPIWFAEINDGIKALALRDQELIMENIRYTYYDDYLYYVNIHKMALEDYSFEDFLGDHIELDEPFDIIHGIEFTKGYDLNRLSKNDWENIADIIVRVSLYTKLQIEDSAVEPIDLADQYHWEKIQFDFNY